MALTAAQILSRAAIQLQDPSYVRWTQDELLSYLNDGRRETAIARPDLYATHEAISLVAGTRQTIPATGARFLDGIRNVNGRAVRVVEREYLDTAQPTWHTITPGPTKHFMYDERDPRSFYVYPPAADGQELEILYSRLPTEITSGNLNVTLTPEGPYVSALTDYVCFRAMSKDAESAANMERAGAYYARYTAVLSPRADLTSSPNTANKGGDYPRTAQG